MALSKITNESLAANTVDSDKIAADAIGTAELANNATINTSGTVTSTGLTVGDNAGGDINLTTNSQAGSQASPLNMDINFKGYNNNVMSIIRSHDESSSTGHGELQFHTTKAGVGTTQKMVIDHDGKVGINTSSPDAKLDVEGTTDAELRITRTTASASGTFNDQGSVLHLFNDVEFENGYNGGASVGQIIFSSDDGSTGQGIRAKIACNKLGYSHSESLAFYVSPANTTSGQCTATSNTLGKVLEIAFNKNMYHRATRLDAEHADFANVHIGDKSSFGSFAAGSTYVVNNAYYNTSSQWVKKVTGASNLINMTTTGDWYFGYSASASAGATTSFTNRYLLNDNGGGIYLYSDGHGNGAITMYNNNIYLAANTGSGEVYATDAAGNHTLLSPHNFQYIPDGKSEDHAWAYLSEKTTPTTRKDANDKDEVDTDRKDGDSFSYVNVDMMKVVREVEKLTGTKLVYTGKDGKDDGSTVKDNIIADLIKRIEALENK